MAIDVLVTHGPPYGIRDHVRRGEFGERVEHSGSPALLEALERVKPRICAFGHIHEGHGLTVMPNGVLCINAASAPGRDGPREFREPIVVDLESRGGEGV